MSNNCKIKFFPGKEACTFRAWPSGKGLQMGDTEQKLHDSIAQEVNQIAGTDIDFYAQDTDNSSVDPLFREPIERLWKGPFKLKAFVEWADSTPEVREEGFRTSFASRCWIARADIDALGIQPPSEGDVIRFWNTPFFNESGLDNEPSPGKGYFFNVTDVDDDGHINDGPLFVGFWCTLQRRTEFSPERRIAE